LSIENLWWDDNPSWYAWLTIYKFQVGGGGESALRWWYIWLFPSCSCVWQLLMKQSASQSTLGEMKTRKWARCIWG